MSYRMHDSQVHRQGFPDWWLDKPSRLNSPSLPLSYKVQNYDQPQLTFVLQMDDLAQAPAVLVTLASLFRLTSRNWQVIVRYNSVELVRSQVLKSLDGLQAFPFVELRRTTERLEVLSPSVWEVDPGQAVTQAALDLHLNDISQGFSGCFMPLSPTYWTVERGLLDAAHA
jgi:hypothetical protein